MSPYQVDNKKYTGQRSLTNKNTTGRKGLSYGYNGNNESIANGGNVRVLRPRPAQQLAVPISTTTRSRPPVPIIQPTSTRSVMPSEISRPRSPTCQSLSPNSRSFPPISRPPTPRPRSTKLRCWSQSQQTPEMHDPSAFTNHQFQTQHGNQMESHNTPCQLFYYQEDESWNRPEICRTDFYQLPPSCESETQPLIEREKNDGIYNNESFAPISFIPIQESNQTKYENDKSSIKPRTGCWQGKSESRRIIRTGQYRKTPYPTKNIVTPTTIGLSSTERTSEKESNTHLPIYGSSPFSKSNINISKSEIVTPLLRAPYLEDGTASIDYPATCPDRDRRVVIQCSTLGETAGGNMRVKYDRGLPGYQDPQQLATPVKQSEHMSVHSTHTTRSRTNSDLTNEMRLRRCQEPNQKCTGLNPTSIRVQKCTNSANETFASHATEQYGDSENDISKTTFTEGISKEISTPSETSDPALTKGKESRPKHLQREEPLHIGKETVAEMNANNTTSITDSPKTAESKDGTQHNETIASLIDRLLKEARTASDLLKQQGAWQQENTTGRICIAKSKNGRPNTCGTKSDIRDKMTPFTRTSARRHTGGIKQNEIGISKEISLLMSDLRICGNKVGPAKVPASSGTCPPVKTNLDSDKGEEEEKRCVIKAKRRLSSNSLSLTTNTSKVGVDRVIRLISSEDVLSNLRESNRSMKGGKIVLRQEEEDKGGKDNILVEEAKKTYAVCSEPSENTKRARSSLSGENIARAKRRKREGEFTWIQGETNTEPEVKSTDINVDDNENEIVPNPSSQEHEVTVSSNNVLVSRKKRTIQEAEEDSAPKLPCISQEPVRSLSKHDFSKYSFISEDHNIPVKGTNITESDNETRKLVTEDTIPENETRKTKDVGEDNDNKAKRRKQKGGVRKSVLIQDEKSMKSEKEDKKRKVGGNGNDIKPIYTDQKSDAAAFSKNEDLESPKNIKGTRVDENVGLKSSCFSHKLTIAVPEQESSNKSVISEESEININGTKKCKSDGETKMPVLKNFIPEHKEREINDDNEENEGKNSLPLRQEPEKPSFQGPADNFGPLLLASADTADISLIASVWAGEKESGPERVRKSKTMRKTQKRRTVVNESKPATSNSLIELFKQLRI
ncbi:hypothetical protein ACJMK2_012382 [Sinanodonta woodiana]|uniref:Uncharacterized protein n=1 Tax=Sinanodonta woodiana TaxID=1069815 RepID=A0ABD3V805_SINWO